VLSVDLQHEFASPQGRLYRRRGCVPFLLDTVFPAAMARQWPIHQILADYRDPSRPTSTWRCAPGTWAGTSLLPVSAGRQSSLVQGNSLAGLDPRQRGAG
jgi:hypothetical protein